MDTKIESNLIQKVKRVYNKKQKIIEPIIEPIIESNLIQKVKRVYNKKQKIDEPIIALPERTEGVSSNIKKPRTEKQIMAFVKMREARQSKQDELNELKLIDRENKAEYNKLNRLNEKVLRKSTNMNTYEEPLILYPPLFQETKVKEYIFV